VSADKRTALRSRSFSFGDFHSLMVLVADGWIKLPSPQHKYSKHHVDRDDFKLKFQPIATASSVIEENCYSIAERFTMMFTNPKLFFCFAQDSSNPLVMARSKIWRCFIFLIPLLLSTFTHHCENISMAKCNRACTVI